MPISNARSVRLRSAMEARVARYGNGLYDTLRKGLLMPLEVIGSGFGRTGTASLKRALETLGFGPCHHMEEVMANPEQVARCASRFLRSI
jgi:hypothetical protein